MATEHNLEEITELSQHLGRLIDGEVKFDQVTRMIYSTDASIYQIEPLGVVIPRSVEDVIATIETAINFNVPVLPRGGGTSLAGQTIGRSIVIDFSKYLNNVIEINQEEKWARVQPGIILDELNHQIRDLNLLFSPDPSTSSRGNVGGAIGNNSCGAHSIVWGKTVDNVIELNGILSNADQVKFTELSGSDFDLKMDGESFESEIYRKLSSVIVNNKEEITNRFPKIQRRVSGYNLDELISPGNLNMARFVTGSEGTLLTITDAKVNLVEIPKIKALGVIHFDDMFKSMEATPLVLESKPSAVEMIGEMILKQAKSNIVYSKMMDFIDGEPQSLLVVEYTGDSFSEIDSKLNSLENLIKSKRLGYSVVRLLSNSDQNKVWNVRKAGLGLMMNSPGDAKPIPFVEDTAVDPQLLPEFVRKFDLIVKENGTTAGYYGHASVGCLHIRPVINLKNQVGVDQMTSIADSVSDLVLEFGGSLSGEHGDGLVRSSFNKKMFGSKIYNAFNDVKLAFDPKNIMNPGKIVDSQSIQENLKIGPNYKPEQIKTNFNFHKENGFNSAIEMCNGQGACKKIIGGTMCPSYMVTRDEEHSTRGRANALRGYISGKLTAENSVDRIREVLDLCLECKACKSECPSNVDMTKLKYEFLHQYHQNKRYSLRDFIFGNFRKFAQYGSAMAPISNWVMRNDIFRKILFSFIGIDHRRKIPEFAQHSFTSWYQNNRNIFGTHKKNSTKVILFPDTFTNYNHPEIGINTYKVLVSLGYEVIVPELKCCGKPLLSKGMLPKAKSLASENIKILSQIIDDDSVIVGIEPSCLLTIFDDYPDLLNQDLEIKNVINKVMLVGDLIVRDFAKGLPDKLFKAVDSKVLFHGHCHQKSLFGTSKINQLLNLLPSIVVEEIQSGCCGMAGTFGFESEHYEISIKMAKKNLVDKINTQSGDFLLVSDGISCRQQIDHTLGIKSLHAMDLFASLLID